MYTAKSAATVWNDHLGIKDRMAVVQQWFLPGDAWKRSFEQFSESEQQALCRIDWEFTTGKKFSQLITQKGDETNGTQQT